MAHTSYILPHTSYLIHLNPKLPSQQHRSPSCIFSRPQELSGSNLSRSRPRQASSSFRFYICCLKEKHKNCHTTSVCTGLSSIHFFPSITASRPVKNDRDASGHHKQPNILHSFLHPAKYNWEQQ